MMNLDPIGITGKSEHTFRDRLGYTLVQRYPKIDDCYWHLFYPREYEFKFSQPVKMRGGKDTFKKSLIDLSVYRRQDLFDAHFHGYKKFMAVVEFKNR
jgi:hypothetical protein